MSAFSAPDFDAKTYSGVRPQYPPTFYEFLRKYHKGASNCAVDAGCGPGIATFQLFAELPEFKEVIGSDLSAVMIERAREILHSSSDKDFAGRKLRFEVSPGDEFKFLKHPDQQECDMITYAESAHWINFESLQRNVAANLRQDGTFAVWGYGDFIVLDYPELDAAIDDMIYGKEKLGKYWDQPGRTYIANMMRDFKPSDESYKDIRRIEFSALNLRNSTIHENESPLIMTKDVTFEEFGNYFKSWSGYHAWKKDHPQETDIVNPVVDKLKQLDPELINNQKKIRLAWHTYIIVCRRR